MTLPVVKRGAATAAQWSLESWTPAGMSEELGSTELDVRFSLRRADRGLVEGDSERERCRLDAFMDWLLGRGHGDEEEGGLARKYPPQDDQWWAYASYIYVSDLWKGRPEVQARFPWSTLSGVFGEGAPAIPIDKPENCAMWIGSKGAFTPCHYDVYGTRRHWSWNKYNCVFRLQCRCATARTQDVAAFPARPERVSLSDAPALRRVHRV